MENKVRKAIKEEIIKLKEQLGPRMKSPRPTGPSDPRSSKDIEFDNAQAMSRLTPDDKDKINKIKQMMDKEKPLKEAGPSNNPYYNNLVKKAKEMGIHVNDLMKSLLKDKSEMEIVKMGYQDVAALAGVEDLDETTDAISTARALRPGGEEEDQQVDKDAVDNEYEDLYNSMLDRDHNDFNDSSLEEISRELGYLGEGEGIEVSLEDLTLDLLKSTFPDHYKDVHFTRMQPNGEEGPYYRDAISLPNADDTMRGVGDESALKDWKQEIFDRFGDVNISLNPSADKWFDKVKITNDDFKTSQDVFIKGKKSFIDKETMAGRSID